MSSSLEGLTPCLAEKLTHQRQVAITMRTPQLAAVAGVDNAFRLTTDVGIAFAMRCALLVLVLVACAQADAPAASRSQATAGASGAIDLRSAWARAADSGSTSGAYVTLANADTTEITITAWRSDVAERTTLHETTIHDGMAHMTPHERTVLARDSVLAMAPGGLHVMLTRLTRALRVGDTVRVTIELADGRSVVVPVVVRSP